MNMNIKKYINMNSDNTPPHPCPTGPVCGRPGMGWGGVTSIFILISILFLFIETLEANECI